MTIIMIIIMITIIIIIIIIFLFVLLLLLLLVFYIFNLQLSCEVVKTNVQLPEGVRILSVFLTADEHRRLLSCDLQQCHNTDSDEPNALRGGKDEYEVRKQVTKWVSNNIGGMAALVRDNYNLKSHKYVCITTYQPD